MSVADYCPERDNDFDDPDYNSDDFTQEEEEPEPEPSPEDCTQPKKQVVAVDKKETLEDIMKTLLKLGDLRTENIIEIQYLLRLIHQSNMNENDKRNCGSCLNMLLTLSNLYLQDYGKKIDKSTD
jgi:hypothetical protein